MHLHRSHLLLLILLLRYLILMNSIQSYHIGRTNKRTIERTTNFRFSIIQKIKLTERIDQIGILSINTIPHRYTFRLRCNNKQSHG